MSFPSTPRALLGVAAVILIIFAIYGVVTRPGAVNTPVPTEFSIGERTYEITYTATDDAQRQAGLMNKKVTNTTTMLFVFPSPGTYEVWMYNTNTSLDVIWINATGATGRVVYVFSGAQPCYDPLTCPRYSPTSPANYIIEVKSGFAAANGIVVGTLIEFR